MSRGVLLGLGSFVAMIGLPGFAFAKAPEPAHPMTIVVTNATEVAKRHEGALLVSVASYFIDVDGRVMDEIAARLGQHLQANGVQAVIGRSDLAVSAGSAPAFYLWDSAAQTLTPAVLQEGTYKTIQVVIQNADEIVRKQRGSGALFAGKLLNVDLQGKVNEGAAGVMLQELSAEGINAMVAF